MENIRIQSVPAGFNNWFYFMMIALFGYWLLLKAGGLPTNDGITKPVDIMGKVNISVDRFHHEPEIRKKPLKLNLKKSKKFQIMIDQAAVRYMVDPDLIRAVIMAESGYNPNAVSNQGARGLMQLMPRTAKAMGVEDSFNPEHNIDGGVRYLKKLLKRYDGNVELALAAYNAGIRRVNEHQGVPPYKATRMYIQKVKEYYLFYKTYFAANRNRA